VIDGPVSAARSIYRRFPASVTFIVSACCIFAVYYKSFLGLVILPYDNIDGIYPYYVGALNAISHGFLTQYDPFNLGGFVAIPFFGFTDPIGFIPWLTHTVPSFWGFDVIQLLHLFLIPAGLLMLARAYDVPRERYLFIIPIALIASAIGPILEWAAWSNATVSYSWGFFLFGCLEIFRKTGKPLPILGAGAALAWAFGPSPQNAELWPIVLVPYAIVYWRQLFADAKRAAYVAGALLLSVLLALPAAIVWLKIYYTIDLGFIAPSGPLRGLLVNMIKPHDFLSMLGQPVPWGGFAIAVVAAPSALFLMLIASAYVLSTRERLMYGLVIGVLFFYSLGHLTPFTEFFRHHVYPPSAYSINPFMAWYVILPLLFALSIRTLKLSRIPSAALYAATAVVIVAGLVDIVVYPSLWFVTLIAAALFLVILKWRRFEIICGVALLQWALIVLMPFQASLWGPAVFEAGWQYLAPYPNLIRYLPFETDTSARAYRVVNVGFPKTFGVYADVYRYYNVASEGNMYYPRALAEKVGTLSLDELSMPKYVVSHPGWIGSSPLEELSVRYYFFNPDVLTKIEPVISKKPWLRLLPEDGFYRTVEDTKYQPFVAAIDTQGRVTPVDAHMTRDSFDFRIPQGARSIRMSVNYDPWWHASNDLGEDLTRYVTSANGELVLDASSLGGQLVRLHYGSALLSAALLTSGAIYLVALVVLLLYLMWRVPFVRALARRIGDAVPQEA
jgi:hypothetical protein